MSATIRAKSITDDARVQVYKGAEHSWAMKLTHLATMPGPVRIVTYSLPDPAYVVKLLGKRPEIVWLVAHAKFAEKAATIKRLLPALHIALCKTSHAKLCLIAPDTVYVGSANFGFSDWHEMTARVTNAAMHQWCADEVFAALWLDSQEVKLAHERAGVAAP